MLPREVDVGVDVLPVAAASPARPRSAPPSASKLHRGGHQPGPGPLGDHERAARRLDRADAGQALVAVVAPGQHLQHHACCRGRRGPAAGRAAAPAARCCAPSRRSARRGPARPGARPGNAGACGCRRRRGRGCGAAAAGRTRRTPRRGPGRRRQGSGPGWPRPAVPGPGRRARAAPRPAANSRSQSRSSVVMTVASAAARCWARKMRNTAASSSGERSRLVDAVVPERLGRAWPGTPPAARPARRPGSAGRCGSSSRALCTWRVAVAVLARRPVAAQLGQVGEHVDQARAPRASGRWPSAAAACRAAR